MEYEYHPTEEVIVYNNKPYPILIEMGFKGKPEIGGTIYCRIYALLPA
jgi:site-specific recombinase